MSRPMAFIGITAFLTLILLGTANVTVAVVLLSVSIVLSVITLSIKKIRKNILIPVICITVSVFCALFIAKTLFSYNKILTFAGDNIEVEGCVVDVPSINNGKYVYTLKTSRIDGQKVKTKIRFSTSNIKDLNPCDKVSVAGTVYVLGANNEDSHKYYKSKQMYLGLYTYNEANVSTPKILPLQYYVIKLRENIKLSIPKNIDSDIAGLINAMLLGDKSNVSDKNYSNFQKIGVSHLIVVSGLHLTMWSSCAYIFLRKTRLPKRISALLSALFVILFMALTGFSISAVRAGIMVLVYYCGEILGRESDSLNSLGLAVLLMCLINPFIAMDYGLMLSFFATFGILVLYPKLSESMKKPVKKINFTLLRKVLNGLIDIISVTLSATIFTLPISVFCIGNLSLISPLSNILLVNVASVIMVCGGASAIISMIPVISFLKYPFLFVSGILSKYFLAVSNWLAKIPNASVSTNIGFIRLGLVGVFIILAATFIIKAVAKVSVIRFTAVLSALFILISVFSYQVFNKNVTNIRIIDVGNGSAIVLNKNGQTALIGCGGDYFAGYNIDDALNEYGNNTLEFLLIPRNMETEASCVDEIIDSFDVNNIIMSTDCELVTSKETIISDNAKITVFGNVTVEYINSSVASAAFIKDGQSKILIVFYPMVDLNNLPKEWLESQVLVSRSGFPIDYEKYNFETVILSCDEIKYDSIIKESREKDINTLATGGYGDIILLSRGNGTYKVRRGM